MISSSDIFNARILVVDDREANVRLLEEILRGAGYARVASTMDPHEVCELHRKHRYDLILLDLLMPGMDGFQVMEGLKQIEIDGYLPVLVITAQPGHKLRALKAGAKDFISKPIDVAEVLTRVHNMLEVRLLHIETKNNSKVLEQTVERLREVERLKNGFLSTVSHELRTPLTSIRGSLGLLASGVLGPLSEEVLELVAVAERNAVRLMALISDILDLERLKTGTIELQFAHVPVASILHRAMESLPAAGRQTRLYAQASHLKRCRIVQVVVGEACCRWWRGEAIGIWPAASKVTIGLGPASMNGLLTRSGGDARGSRRCSVSNSRWRHDGPSRRRQHSVSIRRRPGRSCRWLGRGSLPAAPMRTSPKKPTPPRDHETLIIDEDEDIRDA